MTISKQGRVVRLVLILLSIAFVNLLPQMLHAEEQVIQVIDVSQAQISESSELSEKQLSEVQGQGIDPELTAVLKQEGISEIIFWDENANILNDNNTATGTMNHQSNTLSIQGR